jgi:hypothetical protein
MATITISAGGKQGSYRGEPGVFTGTLVSHTLEGPFDSKTPKFPGEQFRLHEWGFALDGAPDEESMVWMTSGESTGPKSRTFAIITALAGGKEPTAGMDIDTDKLIGRQALLDVRRNDRGYLDAVGIMPLPRSGGGKPAAQPVAQANPDDLPF